MTDSLQGNEYKTALCVPDSVLRRSAHWHFPWA